ncbi:MAG: ATP-binding protein [Alkaliphilus sp.]|nr:ABC transporter ATP-binding protein [bacterium AH-315-L21]PHS33402.1 MAG: ATP-binding protein [Alkaliphilus sp.]
MISVENLYHDYEGKGQYAVNDVSFKIKEGEVFGFLGPSGAGKSTVQNIMTGLLKLQKGSVLYEKKSIKEMKSNFYNDIGVSFEFHNLYLKLTGFENLKYYAGLFDVATKDPMELLEMVALRESAHKRVSDYSKGMKQRIVFARALINNPKILYLDEPTSGLDPATATQIRQLIKNKRDEGCTIFLTTHNMYSADELCDRVAFLNEGKIVAMDTPRNLKMKHGKKAVVVEYIRDEKIEKSMFSLDNEEERLKLNEVIKKNDIQTMHSQEGTLEQTFIKLTGRGLV